MQSAFDHSEKAKRTYSLKFLLLGAQQIPLHRVLLWRAQNKCCVTGWQQLCPWCDTGLLDRPRCQFASVPSELPLGSSPGSAVEESRCADLAALSACADRRFGACYGAVAASTPAVVPPCATRGKVKGLLGQTSCLDDPLALKVQKVFQQVWLFWLAMSCSTKPASDVGVCMTRQAQDLIFWH